MPKYVLKEFQTLIENNGLYLFNKENTWNFQYTHGWSDEDIQNCLLFLVTEDFEDVRLGNNIERIWGINRVDADVYMVECCVDTKLRANYETNTSMVIYIKLAILTDKKRKLAGTVSFHTENA